MLVLLFTIACDRMKGWEKAREGNKSYMKLVFKDILFLLFIPVILRLKLMYKFGEFIPSCYEELCRNLAG